jgi:hypothetical protein
MRKSAKTYYEEVGEDFLADVESVRRWATKLPIACMVMKRSFTSIRSSHSDMSLSPMPQ